MALARALINEPQVLLLDEPLGALDLKLREQMQTELKALQRKLGITFLFITHDQHEALSMSDRIGVFNQGKLEQVGTPHAVYNAPATRFVAQFVGAANVLDGEAARRLTGHASAMLRPERIRLGAAADARASGAVRRGPVLRRLHARQGRRRRQRCCRPTCPTRPSCACPSRCHRAPALGRARGARAGDRGAAPSHLTLGPWPSAAWRQRAR